MSKDTLARLAACAILVTCLALPQEASAQVSVDVGGTAYVDYFYTVSSPVEEREGYHGFTYRRLYLTTDYRLSEDFKGRARLEVNAGTTVDDRPVPIVKDLYLTWNYAGSHSVTMGVAPPPVFEASEKVWDYRSLEKTILDLQDVVDSRDFGVRVNGPIFRGVRYGAMVANNQGIEPESDEYKRGYAQLEIYPIDHVILTVGADHAGFGDESPFNSATRFSGLVAYSTERFAIGVEPYTFVQDFDAGSDLEAAGVSVFGRVSVLPTLDLVARFDRVREGRATKRDETFILGGIAFRPNQYVRIIPNIWVSDVDLPNRTHTMGRLTLDISF